MLRFKIGVCAYSLIALFGSLFAAQLSTDGLNVLFLHPATKIDGTSFERSFRCLLDDPEIWATSSGCRNLVQPSQLLLSAKLPPYIRATSLSPNRIYEPRVWDEISRLWNPELVDIREDGRAILFRATDPFTGKIAAIRLEQFQAEHQEELSDEFWSMEPARTIEKMLFVPGVLNQMGISQVAAPIDLGVQVAQIVPDTLVAFHKYLLRDPAYANREVQSALLTLPLMLGKSVVADVKNGRTPGQDVLRLGRIAARGFWDDVVSGDVERTGNALAIAVPIGAASVYVGLRFAKPVANALESTERILRHTAVRVEAALTLASRYVMPPVAWMQPALELAVGSGEMRLIPVADRGSLRGLIHRADDASFTSGGAAAEAATTGSVADDVLGGIRLTEPSGMLDGKPNGTRTRVPQLKANGRPIPGKNHLSSGDIQAQRGIMRENEAADALARSGYHVEQNPGKNGGRRPDFMIEGDFFDCYSPSTDSASGIVKEIRRKVTTDVHGQAQAQRIVLNLQDSAVTIEALQLELFRSRIAALLEVLIVRNGTVSRLYPFSVTIPIRRI